MNAEDVEALFTRLTLAYGMHALDVMYKAQPIEVVKRAWLHELRALTTSDVAYAMTVLPTQAWPPNVLEFKALALRRAPKAFKRLDAPHASAEHREQAVVALRGLGATLTSRTESERAKAWAWKLKKAEEAGNTLTQYQKLAWREALVRELGS